MARLDGVPGVELDHVHLRRRQQPCGRCHFQQRLVSRVQRRIEPNDARHLVALGVLLEEQLAADARGRTHQRHRPALQVLHHQRPDQRVVAHQLDLGDATGRVDHPIRMAHRSVDGSTTSGGVAPELVLPVPAAASRPAGVALGRLGGLVHRRIVARRFAGDRHRRLVGAQALKHRMPNAPAARPFAEGHLADQLGPDPMRLSGNLGRRRRTGWRRSAGRRAFRADRARPVR